MLNVDWNLALARLSFLDGYLRHMQEEVAMKNQTLFDTAHDPRDPREGQSRAVPARDEQRAAPRWPAHRRFWHRRAAANAATPALTAPVAPAKPQAAKAAEDARDPEQLVDASRRD